MSPEQTRALSRAKQQYRMIHNIYVQLDDGDRRVLRDFNLTNSQYTTLMLLDTDKEQRLIDLSEKMLVARSTITRLIDQMENMGLVQRMPDPSDRRAQLVHLTPAGCECRERARSAHEESLVRRARERGDRSRAGDGGRG